MVKRKFSDAEVERARKRIASSIALVGAKGFLTKKQVKALQKKLKR